ncbi:hypothetical protein BaRGS_00015071, partial [Batillaria attramentaria]
MKCVAVCLALFAVVLGQDMLTTTHVPNSGDHHALTLEWLIRSEVHALLAHDVHHQMTIVQCAEKCDAEFALTGHNAEGITTHMCHMECD